MRKISTMIHSPGDHSGLSCAHLKPGARNYHQVSHVGSGYESFGPSLTVLLGHKQGAGWEVEMPELQLASYVIPEHSRKRG